MLPPIEPWSHRLLEGVTDAMVDESTTYHEDPVPTSESAAGNGLESSTVPVPVPVHWRDAISPAGHDVIVRWETGGQAYYDKVIRGRPVWPGYASGVTIGCGFDLGYHAPAAFHAQWEGLLGAADIERLTGLCGFRTVAPDRVAKVARAERLVRQLSDIVVPWSTAIAQFDDVKLPALVAQLYRVLPEVAGLHPHCRAALLSLVFNRGAAFTAGGERFAEMRAIRAALRAATVDDLLRIPGFLRAMRRIWGEGSSLARRREDEARLFEAGLAEAALLEGVVREHEAVVLERSAPQEEGSLAERHDDVPQAQSDDADEADEPVLLPGGDGLESGTPAAAVCWNPRDDEQPCYRHLDRAAARTTFVLTPADLDFMIEANAFVPHPGKLLFALRGAAIAGAAREVSELVITDQRPDHRRYRCVIGVYDRETGRLDAFPGSTVPNADFVLRCYAMARQGTPVGRLTGNILPTGCYTYAVGTHRRGSKGEIPGVLRLAATADGASAVLVLRSVADMVYDRFDPFMVATPADNLHPGQLTHGFSSAGCLTLPGRYAAGRHTGVWDDFRRAVGFDQVRDGTLFSLMLLTGLDAANAVRARTGTLEPSAQRRLRHGSRGARVAALQAALSLQPDPSQTLGPVTRAALAARQSRVLGWADAIHSPDMDVLLGLGVFAHH